MLQLRSIPSTTVNGNSPAANAEISCGYLIFLNLEIFARQAGHQPPVRVGHGGVHLDQLHS